MEERRRDQVLALMGQVLEDLRELTRQDDALVRRLSSLEERADERSERMRRLLAEVARIEALVGGGAGRPAGEAAPAPPPPAPARPGGHRDLLRLLAQRGVERVEFVDPLEDGSGWMRLDDGRPVKLTAGQLRLMRLLAEDRGVQVPADAAPGADGLLVGWKPVDELVSRLRSEHGVATTPRAVRQMVHTLRRLLERAGSNPWLLQSQRRPAAYRLALRRKAPAAALAAANGREVSDGPSVGA